MVRLLALYTTLSLANTQNNYVLVTYLLDHCWYLLVQHLFEGIPCYAAVHLAWAAFSAHEKEQMIKL